MPAGGLWARSRLPGFAPEALAARAAAPDPPVDVYRAGLLLPVTSPPIADGALAVAAGRILAVGPAPEVLAAHPDARRVAELPGAVLMPGLVNAHCHLGLSFAQGVLPPTENFADWIRRLLPLRRSWTDDELRLSLLAGLRETLRGGCTLLGEILTETEADAGSLLAELAPPLRIRGYHEVLGWLARDRATAWEGVDALDSTPLDFAPGELRHGLSPHAPYSTHPALYAALFERAADRGWPLSTHLAETADELDYQREDRGGLAALRARVGWNAEGPSPWCGGRTVDTWLAEHPPAAPLQLVHGTWLDAEAIARVAAIPRCSAVYCPGSVAWFHGGRDPHPVRAMLDAGLAVGLGTDSLASSPTLNLPLTATLARRAHPELEPLELLWMLTRGGALSLDWPKAGELRQGGPADFVAFSLLGVRDSSRLDAAEAVEGALLSGYRVPGLHVIGGVAHAMAVLAPFPR